MECYIVINGEEYLIPSDVFLANERIISKYMYNNNGKNYLNINLMREHGLFDEIIHIYQTVKNYMETYAMNMAAVGMFSTADLEFDPLVSFMKIKQELNENEKKIKTSEITDDDKYNLIYDGLRKLLMLNEQTIKNDEFEDNKIR